MKIYRAVKTDRITQKFGENLVSYYKDMGMLGHNGVDFLCQMGEKMYWDGSIKGKVIKTKISNTQGFGIYIVTEEEHERLLHIFWHNQAITVKPGQIVETGDLIGLGNSTGRSTGPHLHRGLYEIDKDYHKLNYNNGYHGAIDPMPYFQNIFVVDKMYYLKKQKEELEKKISWLQKLIEAIKRSLKIK